MHQLGLCRVGHGLLSARTAAVSQGGLNARPVCVCVCVQLCTLSASGGDLLNAFPPGAAPLFDVVVVDEAAQALEPATLIPFQLIKPGASARWRPCGAGSAACRSMRVVAAHRGPMAASKAPHLPQ